MRASNWNSLSNEARQRYRVARWRREIQRDKEGRCRTCAELIGPTPSFMRSTRCTRCLAKAHPKGCIIATAHH